MMEMEQFWRLQGAPRDSPALSVEVADNFLRRFLGLMGRESIEPSRALLLSPCSSVHMCFMRFAIDVVYLQRDRADDGCSIWRVIKVVRSLRPWIGVSACLKADAALELASGEAERLGIQAGAVWRPCGFRMNGKRNTGGGFP